MSLSDAPQELLYLIIDHLSSDRRSLRSCSLVCKAFRPRSLFHLFRTIILKSDEHHYGRTADLREILEKNPDIAQCVRRLSVDVASQQQEWLTANADFLEIMRIISIRAPFKSEYRIRFHLKGSLSTGGSTFFPTDSLERLWMPFVAPYVTHLALIGAENVPLQFFTSLQRVEELWISTISLSNASLQEHLYIPQKPLYLSSVTILGAGELLATILGGYHVSQPIFVTDVNTTLTVSGFGDIGTEMLDGCGIDRYYPKELYSLTVESMLPQSTTMPNFPVARICCIPTLTVLDLKIFHFFDNPLPGTMRYLSTISHLNTHLRHIIIRQHQMTISSLIPTRPWVESFEATCLDIFCRIGKGRHLKVEMMLGFDSETEESFVLARRETITRFIQERRGILDRLPECMEGLEVVYTLALRTREMVRLKRLQEEESFIDSEALEYFGLS